MSNQVLAVMLAQLQKEVNVRDTDVQGDFIYFHTKGDPDDFDDPNHRLSEEFLKLMEQNGLDYNNLQENDCEGCAGEFMLDCSKLEEVAVLEWKNKLFPQAGNLAFEAAVKYCRSIGLDFQKVTAVGNYETFRKTDKPSQGRIVHRITIELIQADPNNSGPFIKY